MRGLVGERDGGVEGEDVAGPCCDLVLSKIRSDGVGGWVG